MIAAQSVVRCYGGSARARALMSVYTVKYRSSLHVLQLLVLSLFMVTAAPAASDYKTPKNLRMGWDGKVQLGALATFGTADTTAISARTDFTYRNDRSEHELTTKLYRSANKIYVVRKDVNGDDITNESGAFVKDQVRTTTNDRRYIGVQTRWFATSRYYVFLLADLELNKPADIESSSRQVIGFGYKLWRTRKDYVSAALGVGRKKLEQVSGETEEGGIGYIGLRLRRRVSFNVILGIDLDTDFGAENRFSEAEFAVAWKFRDPVSLKFKYEARFNSNIINPLDTFDEDVEAAMSVNIEVAVFR